MKLIQQNFQNSPLRFLFFLNLVLLLLLFCSFFPLLPTDFYNFSTYNLLNFFCLVIFALLGKKLAILKTNKRKLVYILAELLLIQITYLGGMIFYNILYLVFLIRNCFILSSRQRIVATIVIFVLFSIQRLYRDPYLTINLALLEQKYMISFSFIILFGILVLFLHLLVNTILKEHESKNQLGIANKQLRLYAEKIEEVAILEERNRIAREIHDSLGHSLIIFNLHLEAALKNYSSNSNEALELVKEAKLIGEAALKDVRHSVSTLRSKPLEGKSLKEAIEALIEDLRKTTAITPKCDLRIIRPVSDELKITIYRILQEAITNICKYSQATEVVIKIETNNNLELLVKDNGIGFILEENTTGFGLRGMKERTFAKSGDFQLITAPSQGCQILVSLPLD